MKIKESELKSTIRQMIISESQMMSHRRPRVLSEAKAETEISALCKKESVAYVRNYGKSKDVLKKLKEKELADEGTDGGTLYPEGNIVFWICFKEVKTLQRFFIKFWDWEEGYSWPKDPGKGKWCVTFDEHDDPGARLEEGKAQFFLEYFAKSGNLSEIDKAIDDLIKKIDEK